MNLKFIDIIALITSNWEELIKMVVEQEKSSRTIMLNSVLSKVNGIFNKHINFKQIMINNFIIPG